VQKFYFVQSLRGFAALWVVLFHCSGHVEAIKTSFPIWLVGAIFDAGHYGVAVFFALSGFVIAHSLRNSEIDAAYFWRFILRRSIRLDPPYWASIVIVVVFAAISAKVVSHVFYLQEFLKYPEISTVYWTLTYEVQFYIFLVGSFLLISRKLPRTVLLTLIAIPSALGIFHFSALFLPLWCAFFIGSLAYWARDERGSFCCFAVLFFTMAIWGSATENLFIVISAVIALLMYAVCRSEAGDQFFNIRPLQFLGKISYSIYLIHNPITGASFFLTSRMLGNGMIANLAGLGAAIAACILFSFLLWWAIERPSQLLARNAFRIRDGISEINRR
jgi:peptidoglycan/LPS O-acetylase OafA/YrhL